MDLLQNFFGGFRSPADVLSKGPPEFKLFDLLVYSIVLPLLAFIPLLVVPFIIDSTVGPLDLMKVVWRDQKLFVIGMLVLSFLFGPIMYYFSLAQRRRFYEYTATAAQATQLQDTLEVDFVTNLVKINFKYIDRYYLQTQLQANKSFTLAAIVSVLSVVIIAIGIGMMMYSPPDLAPAYVTAAAGVLSQFISAVFFYLYNQTILKMSEYHRKLVLTQNISLALKISDELPEAERAKARACLIDRLSENFNLYLSQEPQGSKV
jgi:hypothetical protein